jgi:uncharacterized integral membrane protein
MPVLIVTVIFGSIIAYFATQNTTLISVRFINYSLTVPLYFIVIGSLFIGLVVSWIISMVDSVSSSLTIHGKESKLNEAKKETAELTKRIHELELENTKLKAKNGDSSPDDKSS